jgi:hypothetical protein
VTSNLVAHGALRILGLRRFVAALIAVVFSAGGLGAQPPVSASTPRATRSQLTELKSTLERAAFAAKSRDRANVMAELSIVRDRLDRGDFRPGDRFVMILRQDSVRADTLVVRDSLRVAVLNLPEFSVAGVLRAELEERLNGHVARFLRNSTVRTTLLTRVSVTGAVRNPGFYYAVPDRPLNDLLTLAGGPSPEANTSGLTVSRVGRTVLSKKDAKAAINEGFTLEMLNIQDGDVVHLPVKRRVNWRSVAQLGFLLLSVTLALLNFLRFYYSQQE